MFFFQIDFLLVIEGDVWKLAKFFVFIEKKMGKIYFFLAKVVYIICIGKYRCHFLTLRFEVFLLNCVICPPHKMTLLVIFLRVRMFGSW